MIGYIFEYDYFKDSKSTLKETSYDKANKEYMTDSLIEVVDFDKATKKYYKRNKLQPLSSNDALLPIRYNKLAFLEFKNGIIGNKEKYQIAKKNEDSSFVCRNILDLSAESLRDICEYILVYNLKKNEENINKEYLNNEIQQSISFNNLARTISKEAGREYIAFGLRKFEGVYFSKVHTFVKQELDEYLDKIRA